MAQNVKSGDQKFSLARNDLKMAHIYDVGSKDIQTVMGRYVAIEKMKIALGDRVIDFGCGPGNLDFDIADIVGEEGYVFGFDPLPDCIDVARRKVTEKYVKIVRFELGKAEDVPKSAGTNYDHAVMSCMIHWTRRDEALDQGFMVLGKGGCVGISALPGDVVNPWREIKKRVLSQRSYWQLDSEQGLPHHPTEIELKSDLAKVGFIDIQSEVKTHHLAWADAEALMQWLEASTFDNFIPRGPKNTPENGLAEIEALRQVAREAMKGVFEKEYRVDKTDENDKRIAMDMKVLYVWGYKG
ncbi:S-adenosyl-L-methionine-dependent methyltransferase [Hyaloscypha bicolor E]|uniref:S-adenosyl-L-methionine-dependent methyltransferase n=1 Tax=Hyaloscypha bicolor E TaxID=1095630 RepID=A0A2J6T990_9HELO|nr:S-adenosyl-L-methionine-dependent methyltransferase [Hyaloscypha bicolor E]PMD59575.1 S-adenosyl-L-methionine-dependent methyltransferase [Hyaloscypha bicolor E]